MLSQQDTLRRLKMIRHSSPADRIAGRSLTIADVGRETGIAREYLQRIASEKTPLGPKTHAALSEYFERDSERCSRSSARSTEVATGNGSFVSVVFGRK